MSCAVNTHEFWLSLVPFLKQVARKIETMRVSTFKARQGNGSSQDSPLSATNFVQLDVTVVVNRWHLDFSSLCLKMNPSFETHTLNHLT